MDKILRIVFFGSSQFVVQLAKSILDSNHNLVGVVTQPDTLLRGKIFRNPISQFAQENNITVFTPKKINHEFEEFMSLFGDIDICIVASFGQIISQEILNHPKYGFINWHPSNLPKYRGATPIQSSILHGDTESALSWIIMTKNMDEGDILLQKKYHVYPNSTFTDIAMDMQQLGVETWGEAVENRIQNNIQFSQDQNKATFCHKIQKSDGFIDIQSSESGEIYNKWRAFFSFPGIHIIDNVHFHDTVKIVQLTGSIKGIHTEETIQYEDDVWIQTRFHRKQKVYIKCKSGTLLRVTQIGLTGGRKIKLDGYLFTR